MRQWQVGDPVGDGNDIGVPDTGYMGYLKKDSVNNHSKRGTAKDVELSKQYRDEAWRLNEDDKYYDALSFINAAIRYNPDDSENWNIKGIILWNILETNDIGVGRQAYECFNMALEIEPTNSTIKNNKIGFLLDWGIELLYKRGDSEQAMIRANELLSITDDKTGRYYADALAFKATILMRTGNFNESLKYFDKALEANPLDKSTRKLKQMLIERMADY